MFNWGKYSVHNAGWNTYFVARDYHLCTIVRYKERLPEKAMFCQLFLSSLFFLTDFWKH